MGPLMDIPHKQLKAQFDTNVFSILAMVQSLLPLLKAAKNSQVVNIGSVSGILTTPFSGAYCASKAAVHAISDALRMELAPWNIKVICVQPGAIASSFADNALKNLHKLSTESDYQPIGDAIEERAMASQTNTPQASDFAQQLFTALQRPNPKAVIRIGNGSRLLPMAKALLSLNVLDHWLSKKFQLNKLKHSTK